MTKQKQNTKAKTTLNLVMWKVKNMTRQYNVICIKYY